MRFKPRPTLWALQSYADSGILAPMSGKNTTEKRKLDHIRICEEEDTASISFSSDKTTLFECVELLPRGFPACSPDDIDTKTPFLSTTISAPFMVSAMTGGVQEATAMNKTFARACQELGLPMGLGSARAMIEDPALADSFKVRDVAPDIPLIANIGIAQAVDISPDRLAWVVKEMQADALAVHINFAMEAVQPEGNRQPAAVVEAISRIKSEIDFPLIIKEVGAGFTQPQLEQLAQCGADWIDVAGAGGTSWVKIEALRGDDTSKQVARPFFDWGIPTAASLVYAARAGAANIIASGGIRNGLEAAKAMALGAGLCGAALPVLRAHHAQGEEGVKQVLETLIGQLKIATCLCGVGSTSRLKDVPTVIRGDLRDWLAVGR